MAGGGGRAGCSLCDGLGSVGLAGGCIAPGVVAVWLLWCFVALGAPRSLSLCSPPRCGFLSLLPTALLLGVWKHICGGLGGGCHMPMQGIVRRPGEGMV